jgi:holliday junction DNA helicase RuvA
MIAFLEGNLALVEPTHAYINVGGVGYEVKISLNTFSAIKEKPSVKIFTYLYVKEDAQILFGFSELSEKKRFLELISISGVGPSTALMILSSLSSNELQQAILSNDVMTIQKVKGIGTKTAQRIILELKDKLSKQDPEANFGQIISASQNIRTEALAALVTLGINKAAAEKSLQTILKNADKTLSLEELIKLALKSA